MKTLVIHPFDVTTGFLEVIYSNKDWKVIDYNVSHKELKNSIIEHDRIIMMGHGNENGLLGFNRLVINSKLVYLLRKKICYCIWCDADVFIEKYGLKGFHTGMFISESDEALLFDVESSDLEIKESNELFAKILSENIDNSNIHQIVLENYIGDSEVIKFNKTRIYE